ncbi:TolC family protein [Sessilibacter corallicola]|uniref:TolC family protein n=1 Tax=Sessilibacter corallicola TaxID=2904075 RepID=UPI001E488173|nr:TolC family protein [Sessilibacter corallicola]MCE2029157.1 TolC family protein [Sessilibacter corallicola]
MSRITACVVFAFNVIFVCNPLKANSLNTDSLDALIEQAIHQDPYLKQLDHLHNAANARSVSARQLQDPKLRVNYANLPLDTFDTNQEPFTQFQVGISQQFPSGKTRSYRAKIQRLYGDQYPLMAENRTAEIRRDITQLWTRLLTDHRALSLAKNDRTLFEQLIDTVHSGYASGIGGVDQQEFLAAELQLLRFDNRIIGLAAEKSKTAALLSEYVSVEIIRDLLQRHSSITLKEETAREENLRQDVSSYLPEIEASFISAFDLSEAELVQAIKRHPVLAIMQKQYDAKSQEVNLQKQKYKPAWTLNTQYGYRENDPVGNSRADFISLGVEFDLPVFTKKRQDQSVIDAHENASAARLRIDQYVLSSMSEFYSAMAQYQKIIEKEQLYQQQLLPQLRKISESTESVYSAGESSLTAAITAKIEELNTQIEYINIQQQKYHLMAELNYLTVQAAEH